MDESIQPASQLAGHPNLQVICVTMTVLELLHKVCLYVLVCFMFVTSSALSTHDYLRVREFQ